MRSVAIMRWIHLAVAVAVTILFSAAASALTTFDFEELGASRTTSPAPGGLASLVTTQDGIELTIVRGSGARFDVVDLSAFAAEFPTGWGSRALDPLFAGTTDDFFVGTFSSPVVSVELEFTDFGEDTDLLELRAFSIGNGGEMLLGAVNGEWSNSRSSPDFLALRFEVVSGLPIHRIEFRGGSSGFFPNSMFIDNIAVVPEPATLLLVLGPLAGFILFVRRRHS
jgi:hypothetical protein